MIEEIENMLRAAKEFEKLPAMQPSGSPSNTRRAIAAAFIFAGDDAEAALRKADVILKFYDLFMGDADEQSDQS